MIVGERVVFLFFLGCVFKATMKRCCRFFGCYGMFSRGLPVANIVWKRWDIVGDENGRWIHLEIAGYTILYLFWSQAKRSKVKAGNETNSVEISVPLQFDIHGNLRVPPQCNTPQDIRIYSGILRG